MGVWDPAKGSQNPVDAAWKAEWGKEGREAFESHRDRTSARREAAAAKAAQRRARPQTPGSTRNLVFGFLVIEGVVAFITGVLMMTLNWPPIRADQMYNRLGFAGMGVTGASMLYMMFVGIGIRLYGRLNPMPPPDSVHDGGTVDSDGVAAVSDTPTNENPPRGGKRAGSE